MFGRLFGAAYALPMRLIEPLFTGVQRLIGARNMPFVFLAPIILIFAVFVYLPIGLNFQYSVTGGSGLLLEGRPYVGAEHFERLGDCDSFRDPASCRDDLFWVSVWNTLLFFALDVGLIVGFALVTALILNRAFFGRGFFRAIFFYPVMLSPVVIAFIWKWILQYDGLLNGFMLGFGVDRTDFLSSSSWAFGWVVFLHVWSYVGFYTLLLLAGLQAIPSDIYEAAQMDGTRRWRQFTRITMPLLMPTFLVVVLLSGIRAVQVFDEVFAFTGGGPGRSTFFIMQYIYERGFASFDRNLGLAAAASLLLAAVLFTFSVLSAIGQRKKTEGES